MKVKSLSRVRLFATPWTVAYQAPQSMEFSRQEYWSGVPLKIDYDQFIWSIYMIIYMINFAVVIREFAVGLFTFIF